MIFARRIGTCHIILPVAILKYDLIDLKIDYDENNRVKRYVCVIENKTTGRPSFRHREQTDR